MTSGEVGIVASVNLNRVLSNSALMFVRTAFDAGVNLLLSVMLVRGLGESALGTYIYASSLAALIYSLLGLGINTIITREIAQAPANTRKIVSNGISIRLCVTLPIAFATVYVFSRVLLIDVNTQMVVLMVALSVGFGFVTDLVFGVFQAVGRFEYHFILSIFYKLSILFLAWLAVRSGQGLVTIVCLFVGMQVLTMVLSLLLMNRKVTPIGLGFNFTFWRSLIRQSLPLAFSGFSETANNRSDSVLLGSMRSVQEVGIYGAAYNLYLGGGLLVYSLIVGAFPALSQRSIVSRRAVFNLFIWLALLMLVLTGLFALVSFAFSPQIVLLVYGSNLSAASKPFSILTFALVFFGLERLCLVTLTSVGLQRYVFWATLVGAIVNVSLNLVVIPRFGYMGAAYSTLLTEIIMFVLGMFFLLKNSEMKDLYPEALT